MRILLKKKNKDLFFSTVGKWTQDISKAQCFPSAFRAYHFCLEHLMENTQIVFQRVGHPLPSA